MSDDFEADYQEEDPESVARRIAEGSIIRGPGYIDPAKETPESRERAERRREAYEMHLEAIRNAPKPDLGTIKLRAWRHAQLRERERLRRYGF